MTIHLPQSLEKFVQKEVAEGRYKRAEDVVRDALSRLQKGEKQTAKRDARARSSSSSRRKKKLTEAQFQQEMVRLGLVSGLPDKTADSDDPAERLITIKGEPLSKTVIRERR